MAGVKGDDMVGKSIERKVGGDQNRNPGWFSDFLPMTSTRWIVGISVFLLSSWIPALSWLPTLLIFAYLESEGRAREKKMEGVFSVEVEERGRELREEMARMAKELKELKMKLEVSHNNSMEQAIEKEDLEQSAGARGSDERSWEESLDARLEEKMGGVASKVEESVLLGVEAKLDKIVGTAVELRIEGAKQEQFEKSLKLEDLVEKAVRLRMRAELNQLDNSSTSRSGALDCFTSIE